MQCPRLTLLPIRLQSDRSQFHRDRLRSANGKNTFRHYETLELDYVGVKSPQFSYSRLKGANPVAHVEMASTGEVACIADNLLDAFYRSWLSTEQNIKGKRLLVSIGGDKKPKLLQLIKKLDEQGWEIYSTENTHDYLCRNGIASHFLYKGSQRTEPNVLTAISERQVDLIINIPRSLPTGNNTTDGFKIRRIAIDHHIPLITNLHLAQLFLQCLVNLSGNNIFVKSLQEFQNKAECVKATRKF